MNSGQKFYTLAALSKLLTIRFDAILGLANSAGCKPAFHLNGLPYYLDDVIPVLEAAVLAHDRAAAAAGVEIRFFAGVDLRFPAGADSGPEIKASAAPSDLIIGGGEIELQASAGDGPVKVKLIAYSGGIMAVGGFGDVLIDLKGMFLPASVPLLAEHNSSLAGAIGSVVAVADGGKLVASGSIVREADQAGKILALARGGMALQASVGAQPLESRNVRPGETITVNGRTITASREFRLITKSTLREISVVTIGADVDTSVSIAASAAEKQKNMPTEFSTAIIGGEVDPAITAERQRTSAIAGLAAKYPNGSAFIAAGIRDGIAPDAVELKCLRASRTGVPHFIAGGRIQGAETSRLLSAALTVKLCGESRAEKLYGAQTMEQSKLMHRMHMLDLCRLACEADGIITGDGSAEIVRAALSGVSLPNALGDSAEKRLLVAYNEAPASWRSFASVQPASNFKPQKSLRPTWGGQTHEVPAGGELKHNTISEGLVVDWQISTYGEILSLDRRDVVNDDLSIFDQAADSMGRKSLRGVSDLVWQVILANAGAFFHANNGNLMTGTGSALSIASLGVAIGKFLVQRDSDGNDLDIVPQTLVVPPELQVAAQQILSSLEIRPAAATTGDTPTGNALRQALKLEVESRLSNVIKWPSTASLTAFHVFGAPSSSPLVVGFLGGRQTPVVEALGMAAQADRLAYQWRVYHDYGAALGDPRACVKSAGA